MGLNILDQTYNEGEWNEVVIKYINNTVEHSISLMELTLKLTKVFRVKITKWGEIWMGCVFRVMVMVLFFYLDGIPGVTHESVKLNYVSFGGVEFNAAKGREYEIQVSHDLKQWSKIGEIKNTSGVVEFIDPRQPIVPFRRNFYRVKLVN